MSARGNSARNFMHTMIESNSARIAEITKCFDDDSSPFNTP
jgi:hypothetical protein